jgi:hypothetical protein
MERYIYVVSEIHEYIDDTIHQQPLYRSQLAISLSCCRHDRFVINDAGLFRRCIVLRSEMVEGPRCRTHLRTSGSGHSVDVVVLVWVVET